MKIMKKLMALALASALALTLLTGCGGGGGGGGAISDGNGGTITISGTQNANTEFSKAFINAQASTGINMSYEAAKGAKAQKFMEVVVDLAKKNPNQKLDEQFVLKILDKAGIDVTEEMVTEYERKSRPFSCYLQENGRDILLFIEDSSMPPAHPRRRGLCASSR